MWLARGAPVFCGGRCGSSVVAEEACAKTDEVLTERGSSEDAEVDVGGWREEREGDGWVLAVAVEDEWVRRVRDGTLLPAQDTPDFVAGKI